MLFTSSDGCSLGSQSGLRQCSSCILDTFCVFRSIKWESVTASSPEKFFCFSLREKQSDLGDTSEVTKRPQVRIQDNSEVLYSESPRSRKSWKSYEIRRFSRPGNAEVLNLHCFGSLKYFHENISLFSWKYFKHVEHYAKHVSPVSNLVLHCVSVDWIFGGFLSHKRSAEVSQSCNRC